ncbi:hypothetical protein LTR78_003556 [Recurvomyces mirabilis]|uniref:Calcineurin-like phosphoesterase domain-containing protein n=1 Tax=Recurvomyces mirabilis TaxID=574656 RepID=A0AAE0WSF3_9PEZI|nr:hypothetical protein LTR78_003556 [Recurvomyces mirabilis]KAK5154412.1 hypothetical protein LTS14_006547 [Recurvomyces mirabilis]
MRPSDIFLSAFRFLIPPALILPAYVYLYPALQGCSFPVASPGEAACYFGDTPRPAVEVEIAPIRLLTLADPQLEGDSSLPDPDAPLFPGLGRWREDGMQRAVIGLVAEDVPRLLAGYRKRLDLWGNDLYLAHVYRTMMWWTDPTHTVVLGDLLGSQWIDDAEFEKRSDRFWNTVFRGGHKIGRDVTESSREAEVLSWNKAWKHRIIAVAGNHDIGYAGDINPQRIERFEKHFGSVNWQTKFRLNASIPRFQQSRWNPIGSIFQEAAVPELQITVLNSMNLDSPAWDDNLRQQSLAFWNQLSNKLRTDSGANEATGHIVLTHIPLHKKAGICVDPPYFSYFPADQGGGIREQNHLSEAISLEMVSNLTRSGHAGAIVLNGHDHEGCDTYHYLYHDHNPPGEDVYVGHLEFRAARWRDVAKDRTEDWIQGIREITVRSMMGEYGGNAGLLSAWFDEDAAQWRFEYASCMFGVQHIWWGVHIFVLVEVGLGLVGAVCWILERREDGRVLEKMKKA